MKYSVNTRTVDDVLRGVASLDAAQAGYEEAKQFYEGTPPEIVGDGRIAAKLRKTGQDYVFRLSKTPVDYMSDRVKIVKVTANDEAVDLAIAQVNQANQMDIWGPTIIKNAFIKGDVYVLVVPVDAEDDDESDEVRNAGVRYTMLNPENTRAIYDDLGRDPVFVIRSYGFDSRRVVEVYYADGVACWITRGKNLDVAKADSWEPFVSDINPAGWFNYPYDANQIPIFHVKADTFLDSAYGKPEHYDAFGAQNAVNSALLTQIESMKEVGFPQRYMIEKENADDKGGIPDLDLGGPTTDLSGAGLPSNGNVGGPGTILNDPRAGAYGQFTAAGPEGFLSAVDFYIRLMSQETGTPLYAFDPSKEMSGISRQNADAPLKNKIENRTTRLSSVFTKIFKFALALKGVDVEVLQVKWKNQGLAYDSLDAAAKVADVASKLSGVLPPEMIAVFATAMLDEVLEIDLEELFAGVAAPEVTEAEQVVVEEEQLVEADVPDEGNLDESTPE